MPSAAGDYNRRFEWFAWSLGTADGKGQKPNVFTSQGYLWGSLEDSAAAVVEDKARDVQETTATVRVRNLPAIAAGDRLTDAGYGDTWEVVTVRRSGPDERACEVRNDRR